MRSLWLLLLCVAPLAAQDELPAPFEAFGKARAAFAAEGGREDLLAALRNLEELGDARAIEPVAAALAGSIGLERRLLEEGQEEQRRGADAQDRLVGLQGEIKLLRQREQAGATGIESQIRERLAEAERLERTSRKAQVEWERLRLRAQEVSLVRDAYVGACGRMLAKAGDSEAGREGIATLRRHLDASRSDHVLHLVRVLRVSGLESGAPCLIEVLSDPQVADGVARGAISALARLRTRAGALALVGIWERDPEGLGVQVRHALSMAARKRIADPEEAKAWAAELEK
jgi:hypothetical protein